MPKRRLTDNQVHDLLHDAQATLERGEAETRQGRTALQTAVLVLRKIKLALLVSETEL